MAEEGKTDKATEGKTGTKKKIQRLKKGDKTRTAMHAEVMNEIIDAINALYDIKFANDLGEVFYSDSNIVILLSTETCN